MVDSESSSGVALLRGGRYIELPPAGTGNKFTLSYRPSVESQPERYNSLYRKIEVENVDTGAATSTDMLKFVTFVTSAQLFSTRNHALENSLDRLSLVGDLP